MSYKLVLRKIKQKSPDRNRILIHAMFQLLVDFIEQEKGMTFLEVDYVRTWNGSADGPAPHPFEIMYAGANAFSRVFYWKRWRKVLAQAYLYHEIEELTGPDATPEDLAYSAMVQLQQDLYLWYIREYREYTLPNYTSSDPKEQPTDDKTIDEKLHQLISIRHTLWT